jgi:glycosyltransferase involved in cell wall biosynthesis
LRIAYFVNWYPKVSHTFIRREILALERLGFEIQRIALRGWGENPPDPEDRIELTKTQYILRQGIFGLVMPTIGCVFAAPWRFLRVLKLAVRLSHRSDRRVLLHLVRVMEACRLARWLRRSGAQRLHTHFGTNSAEVAMFAHVLGGPRFSITVHGPEEFESPMGIGDKVGHAAFVAAISSFGRSQLYLRSKPRDWPKVHEVRCGLEASFYEVNETLSEMPQRLVCVGRLCEAKGQLLLIQAAGILRSQGITFDLVLAGDGPIRAEIESAVREWGLLDSVTITGWVSSERVRHEILSARALVLPSFAEGLPVVIMEAMALRRPVLSTYVAGIPELVLPEQNGWLFPAGSIDDLVAALKDCLSRSADELRQMGRAAHERVVQRHSIDTEASKLASLLRA